MGPTRRLDGTARKPNQVRLLVHCIATVHICTLVTSICICRCATGCARVLKKTCTAQLSPSGRLLFTSALREPGRVWDVRSGKLLKELPGGRGHFTAARFNSSESQLLTGNTSGQIQLWSLSSGEQQAIWRATTDDQWVGSNQPVEDVAFAGSGYLAAGANGRVYFLKK